MYVCMYVLFHLIVYSHEYSIHVVPVSRRRKDQQEQDLRQVQPCCSPSVSIKAIFICHNMFLTSFPSHLCLSKSLNNFEMWCNPHGEAMCEVWSTVWCDAKAKAQAKVSQLEVSQPNFLFMIPRLQMENTNLYVMLMNHRKSRRFFQVKVALSVKTLQVLRTSAGLDCLHQTSNIHLNHQSSSHPTTGPSLLGDCKEDSVLLHDPNGHRTLCLIPWPSATLMCWRISSLIHVPWHVAANYMHCSGALYLLTLLL